MMHDKRSWSRPSRGYCTSLTNVQSSACLFEAKPQLKSKLKMDAPAGGKVGKRHQQHGGFARPWQLVRG